MKHKGEVMDGVVCGVKEKHGEEYEKKDQGTSFRQWRGVYK